MKRNILLILSIITLIFCIYNFRIQTTISPILTSTKLSDYLYSYKLNDNKSSLHGVYIEKENIFYLLKYGNNYELYQKNIYYQSVKKVNSISSNNLCNLKNQFIACTTNNKIEIYNLKFENLLEIPIENNEAINIIPYKDTFLKLKENKLYLIQNNKEILFKNINIENANFKDLYFSENNTFILLYNENTNTYFIYNINSATYITINSKNANTYQEGFYFYDQTKFKVYNILKDEWREYDNKLANDIFGVTLYNDKVFYLYDAQDSKLIILDYNQNTLASEELNIDISQFQIYLVRNFLYIISNEKLYLLDLDKLNSFKINFQDSQTEETTNITDIIAKLETDYNINIHIKENDIINFPDFNALSETNNLTINNALLKFKPIFNKFDKNFYNSFFKSSYKGLNIYLTGSLSPIDYSTQISNPAAYSLTYENKYLIVIDINQSNIEELLCHELMHNIELNLNHQNKNLFPNWSKYNPPEFAYINSYTKNTPYNYTLKEELKENIYFIDKYSHSYAAEDRARIFENICSCNENSFLKEYPNLLSKALYLKEELIKYYPNLNNSLLFNSLN